MAATLRDQLLEKLRYAENFTPHKVEYYRALIVEHDKQHPPLFRTMKEAEQHIESTSGINGMSKECAVIIDNGNGPGFRVYWDSCGVF